MAALFVTALVVGPLAVAAQEVRTTVPQVRCLTSILVAPTCAAMRPRFSFISQLW